MLQIPSVSLVVELNVEVPSIDASITRGAVPLQRIYRLGGGVFVVVFVYEGRLAASASGSQVAIESPQCKIARAWHYNDGIVPSDFSVEDEFQRLSNDARFDRVLFIC